MTDTKQYPNRKRTKPLRIEFSMQEIANVYRAFDALEKAVRERARANPADRAGYACDLADLQLVKDHIVRTLAAAGGSDVITNHIHRITLEQERNNEIARVAQEQKERRTP